MHIFVTVKTRKKENKVEKIDNTHYVIWTKEIPQKGKANIAVIKLLASKLHLPPSSILLKSGLTSKQKIFEINSIYL